MEYVTNLACLLQVGIYSLLSSGCNDIAEVLHVFLQIIL